MYVVSRLSPQAEAPPDQAYAEYWANLMAASLDDASPVLQ
jgi:hypothetical protein